MISVWLCLLPSLLKAQPRGQVSTVAQLRKLSSSQAAEGKEVRVRGVVTGISGWKSSFFFQDSTAGISVDRDSSSPELIPGQRVELLGITHPGKFAPVVQASSVKVIGNQPLPSARVAQLHELTLGTLDSQWTTVTGFVRTAVIKSLWGRETLLLEVDLGGGTLVTARVRNFTGDSWRRLPAAQIALRGVCGTVFNDRREFVAARFFVSSMEDITVLKPGPDNLYDRPLQSLSSLTRFEVGASTLEPIRVRGVVTSVQPGGRVYLQNAMEAALLKLPGDTSFAPGTSIEVVGYPAAGDYAPLLDGSIFRLLPLPTKPLEPLRLSASKVIVEKDGFPTSPYDALLIRLQARIIQTIPGDDDSILFLQDEKTIFTARLPGSAATQGLPQVGSIVQLTGICATRVDDAHEPHGFRLLLQKRSDIILVSKGPWWTADHAKQVVAVLVAALILMSAFLIIGRKVATLKHISLSDSLTGVHNRRGFALLAEQQWRLAQRNRSTMLLFYIDLDKFKEINDSLGHKQGDLALRTVAGILKDCFRTSDVIGRIGGDEFAIVACEAMPQSREVLEQRLQTLLERSNRRSGSSFELSLSIGALECDSSMSGASVDDLLAKADEMMYEQKAVRKDNSRANSALQPANGSAE